MKRIIKFRCWSEHNKEMYVDQPDYRFDIWGDSISYVPTNGDDSMMHFDSHSDDLKYKIEVMQYSGMKDKNGTYIYEGDILSINQDNGETVHVICEYGINQRNNESGTLLDIPSFYFKKQNGFKSYPIVKNHLGKSDLETMEVIGNIYQNPELLINQS